MPLISAAGVIVLTFTLQVILCFVAPYIIGTYGPYPASLPLRALIVANTAYLGSIFILVRLLQLAPNLVGPAANAGAVVGLMAISLIIGGRRLTVELGLITALLAGLSVWACFALNRAPVA